MDTLKTHFTVQRAVANARLDIGQCAESEVNALQSHVVTLDGIIRLIDYVTTRCDENSIAQDDWQLSVNERAAHRHKCVAYSNVVGAIRQCFGLNTGKKYVTYIDARDEIGALRRYGRGKSSTTALELAERFDTAEEARADLDKSNDYWKKEGKILEVDDVLPTPVATTGPSIG